jgi:hypothetical protein
MCLKQLSRRIQRLSIDDAGRHGDAEFASEPLELHMLDACLAQRSRLRRDVPEQKREEPFFLIPKVDTLFVSSRRYCVTFGRCVFAAVDRALAARLSHFPHSATKHHRAIAVLVSGNGQRSASRLPIG